MKKIIYCESFISSAARTCRTPVLFYKMLFAAAQLIAVCFCTPQVSPELRDHLLVRQPEQQRVVCG